MRGRKRKLRHLAVRIRKSSLSICEFLDFKTGFYSGFHNSKHTMFYSSIVLALSGEELLHHIAL